jgi:poly-gamma-glutamate synthesis protein (capsule biosynthesis protein)
MDSGLHGALRVRLALASLAIGTGLLAAVSTRTVGGPVRIALLGDVMLGRGVERAHAAAGWGESVRSLAPLLNGADLALANLESPLTTAPLVRPALDLRAAPAAASILPALGIDVVSLANNHALDAGLAGIEQTLEALRAYGIEAVGSDEEAWAGTIHGLRIRVLAFDDTTLGLDILGAQSRVRAQSSLADLVIISIHWGSELEEAPSRRQLDLSAALAQAGADVIVGHGPHVLQEAAWIWGAGRGRPTLVAFSLGNTIFDTPSPPSARRSAVLVLTAARGGVIGACEVPFELDPIGWDLEPAPRDSAAAILRSLSPPGEVGPRVVEECPGSVE